MTPGPWTGPTASSLPLAGWCSLRVAGGVKNVAEAVLGTVRVGWGEARGQGTDPEGADSSTPPHPPFLNIDSCGEGRESRPGRVVSSSPAPEFLGGHLHFPHAYLHTRNFQSRLSTDLMTVTWRLPWHPRWASPQGRGPRFAAGEVYRPGEGQLGLSFLRSLAPLGASLYRGGSGLEKSRAGFHPS